MDSREGGHRDRALDLGQGLGPGAGRQDWGWGGSSWLGWAGLGLLSLRWALDSELGVGCEPQALLVFWGLFC